MKNRWSVVIIVLIAVGGFHANAQTASTADRVVSGNANLSQLAKESSQLDETEISSLLKNPSVNVVIIQERSLRSSDNAHQEPQYWILYAIGRDTTLKEKRITLATYNWLVAFATRVDRMS